MYKNFGNFNVMIIVFKMFNYNKSCLKIIINNIIFDMFYEYLNDYQRNVNMF